MTRIVNIVMAVVWALTWAGIAGIIMAVGA